MEAGESLVDVPVKPSSSLSRVLKACQSQDYVMDSRRNLPRRAFRHADRIFVEGYISVVMQAGFNLPMLPCQSR